MIAVRQVDIKVNGFRALFHRDAEATEAVMDLWIPTPTPIYSRWRLRSIDFEYESKKKGRSCNGRAALGSRGLYL